MAKNYYDILEVKKTDSIDVIKKNYKKLALKYHPDKAKTEEKKKEYEEKFKEINEAYATISDEGKRRQYDMGESTPFGQRDGQRNSRRGENFSDIFSDLFGGGGFGENSYEEEPEGQDVHLRLTIKFVEAAFGVEKEIMVRKDIECKSCNGSGSENGKFDICNKCRGQGRIEVTRQTPWGLMRRVIECDECDGRGKSPKIKCKKCQGSGVVNKREKVKVKIPAGIDNDQTLRVTSGGNEIKDGRAGDLLLTINVKPHKIFKRQKFDIIMDLPITFSQAALGCEISVPTLKDEIKIKIMKGTESGNVLRLRNKGIPYINNPNYKGDQFVNITVKTPKRLTREQSKLFEELRKLDKN